MSSDALSDWLWQTSWQAGLLVVLVLIIQRGFNRWLTPGLRCLLWLPVLVRLVLPPVAVSGGFGWPQSACGQGPVVTAAAASADAPPGALA